MGYIIQVNNQGKYVLQMYSASADQLPSPDAAAAEDFETLEAAVRRYARLDQGDFALEYGLHVNLSNEKENPIMQTKKYARKPFYVEAVQVTSENMAEVTAWAGGEIQEDQPRPGHNNPSKFIFINVERALNERQTKAYVGDWVLKAGPGFKVYTNKAFLSSFEVVEETQNVFENASA